MESVPYQVPRLFDKDYFNDYAPTSSSPHMKSPLSGVRLIGGLPFEVVVIKTKRFFVPYHCPSCNRIRETLVDVADDDEEFYAKDQEDAKRNGGVIDEGISEWIVNDEPLENYYLGSNRKTCIHGKGKIDAHSGVKPIQGYFKGPKSFMSPKKCSNGAFEKQKYSLKYTHRDETDSQTSTVKSKKADVDIDDECASYLSDEKEKVDIAPYTVSDELKPWPSFTYIDTRLEYYTPRGSTIQIQNHTDLKQFCQESISYTSETNEDKQKFADVCSNGDTTKVRSDTRNFGADDFVHYVDHKFHLEHYKHHKNRAREKEVRVVSAKRKDSEQHLSLPRVLQELPEALRADLEFWSTYDIARKKQTGKGMEDSRPFLPQIDVTRESLINLALLDQHKKDKTKEKQKDERQHFDNKSTKKKKIRKTKLSSTSYHKQQPDFFSHSSLKGGTAPKHFVEPFNALRVRSSGHVIEIDQELQKELHLFHKSVAKS